MKYMWVVFLMSSFATAMIALAVVYIGNKVINSIRRDDAKLESELKEELKENKGE